MKNRFPFVFAVLLMAFSFNSTKAQDINSLKEVNQQVWSKFYSAFENLDFTLLAEIHSKDVIRIPADSKEIIRYDEYMQRYKEEFAQGKTNNLKMAVSLRFTERITSEKIITERGIFRFSVTAGDDKEQHYYGKFHVLHIKIDGVWKILMDYDSSENNSIDVNDYNSAFAIDNFTLSTND